MPTILITGGSGYLGSMLVRHALAGGWRVAATYHSQPPPAGGATMVPLDLADTTQTAQLIAALQPAVIIHTAYRQNEPGLQAITVHGAQAVAQAAQQQQARLIHLSSDAVFDGEQTRPYRESDAPSPLTPYGAAKAAAERLVAQAHPAALIVRTSLIYGGASPSKHEQVVLDALSEPTTMSFFTDEIRCPVQVDDLAHALLELIDQPVAGPLNLAGSEAISRYGFACLVARAHGHDPATLQASTIAASGQRRPRTCVLDSSAAQRLISTRLRGVSEVLST